MGQIIRGGEQFETYNGELCVKGLRMLPKKTMADWLNSEEIQELRKSFNAFEKQQNAEDDAWWDNLDQESRARAFRQITKLMHQAEVKDRGSYRWAIYDVFGLDYGDGLAHYMALHNLIGMGLDSQASK